MNTNIPPGGGDFLLPVFPVTPRKLGVSPSTVRRLIEAGKISTVRVGVGHRISAAYLDSLVTSGVS